MAVITPDSDVILLKVPLEMDEKNQLTFANATAQYNSFYGLTGKKIYDKFTYQRKDGTITVPDLVDNLYGYNYVMYRNENGKYILLIFLIFGMALCLIENVEVTDQTYLK